MTAEEGGDARGGLDRLMWRSIFARWMGRFGGVAAPRTWKDEARERGLVPVMDIDWETLYAIDPEGRVVRSEWTDWRDVREETDPRARHIVLAQAALRDPEMVHLRPARKPDDPDCTACEGTGTLAGSRRICECGGLGWLPAEVARESR